MKQKISTAARALLVFLLSMLGWQNVQAQEAYAYIASSDNTTLTFYYDTSRSSRNSTGTTYALNTGATSPAWYAGNARQYITKVVFDSSFANARPTSTFGWFRSMQNLKTIEGFYNLNTSEVTNMSFMFNYCTHLTYLYFRSPNASGNNRTDNSHFDTSKVTDMSNMFSYCGLVGLDLSGWDTRAVTTMEEMFNFCSSLETITLGRGNVASFTTESIGWNTSNVTNMDLMFGNCKNLTTIKVGFSWNTDNVSTSNKPFTGCQSLVGGAGSAFATWGGTYNSPTNARIDGGAKSEGGTGIGYLTAAAEAYAYANTGKTQLTFYCDELRSLRTGGTTYDLNTESSDPGWLISISANTFTSVTFDASFANASPTSTYKWFCNMAGLESITGIEYLNTSEVTNMGYMFCACKATGDVDLSGFNTSKVTDMGNMFSQCKATSLDLTSFNTSNVVNMNGMFRQCSNLTKIYVSSYFKVDKVTSSSNMFTASTNLVGSQGTTYSGSHVDKTYAHIDGGEDNPGYFSTKPYAVYNNGTLTFYDDGKRNSKTGTKYDLNEGSENPGWYPEGNTVSNITNIVFDASFASARPTSTYAWFYNCSNVTGITGIEYLNTSAVTNMNAMFNSCRGLSTVDLSGFNTAKVNDMSGMFRNCVQLQELDLSNWNTAIVTDMGLMFYNCPALKKIYVSSGWQVGQVTNSVSMFDLCNNLVGGNGTPYDSSHRDKEYARIDGGPSSSTPGYLSVAPYAVYYNGTLTFYLDSNRSTRTGTAYSLNDATTYPKWREHCTDITKVEFASSFANARPVSTRGWFYGMENLTTISYIERLNTSEVTSMYAMFYKCPQLTALDLSGFNTANVTDMSYMFMRSTQLKTIYISNSWSTASVTSSQNMFMYCSSLVGGGGTVYDADHVDVGYAHNDQGTTNPGYLSYKPYAVKNTNSSYLYFYADGNPENKSGTVYYVNTGDEDPDWYTAGISPNITGISFDASFANARPITTKGWFSGMTSLSTLLGLNYLRVDEVTNMEAMFKNCSALTTLNLSVFNTAKVTTMQEMFRGCTNLATINVSAKWTTDSVTTSTDMFTDCTALVGGNGTEYDASKTDKEYARLDVEGAPGYFTSAPYAVYNNGTLTFYNDGLSEEKEGTMYILTSNSNVETPGWSSIAGSVTKVVFDPSFVTIRPAYVNRWFSDMSNLTTIEGMKYFNFSSTLRFSYLFYNCSSLTEIDLSNFTFGSQRIMDNMFNGCSNLETIFVASNWTVGKVNNGDNMFKGCTKLVGGAGTTWSSSNPTDKTYARIDGGPDSSTPGYLTNGTKEEYAVWDSSTATLTHYYDWKKSLRTETATAVLWGQGYWEGDEQDFNASGVNLEDIQKVIYDPSIADYGGTMLEGWKCGGYTSLTTIEGLQYMDTSNETYLANMFSSCSSLETLDLSALDTRNAKNMSSMFSGCTSLQNLTLGENFSTENVTDMSYMFASGCNPAVIDAITNHEGFSTANVTDMSYMFYNNTGISQLSLEMFNTAKVTAMTSMFSGCSSLTTINVSFDWTTAAVTQSKNMFYNCPDLVGGDGTVFNSSKIDAGYAHIDGGTSNPGYLTATKFTPYVVFDETTSTLTFYADGKQGEKTGTFYDLPADGNEPGWREDETNYDVTKVVFDKSFVTARPTSTWLWFSGMDQLTDIEGIENLNTSEVTTMSAMFGRCSQLKTLDLTTFYTQNVTNMSGMFWGCHNLETVYVGSGWTTANVNNGAGMFYNCFNLVGSFNTMWGDCGLSDSATDGKPYAHIDGGTDNPGLLSGKTEAYVHKSADWKTVTFYYDAMRLLRDGTTYDLNTGTAQPGWYSRPTSVTTVIFDPSFAEVRPTSTYQWFCNMTNLPAIEGLEYLNTSEVTTMNSMFYNCRSLTDIDLSSFDTQKVTDMGAMFRGCTGLQNVNLSSFDTDRRMSFNHMFRECSSLKTLDLSSFKTAAVYNMTYMFNGCSSLETIYVGEGWNASNVVAQDIFTGCKKLVGGAGTSCDGENNLDKAYAIIDGGPDSSTPGYLTAKHYAYAIYTEDNTTLTFYYDNEWYTRTGTKYDLNALNDLPDWYTDGTKDNVTTVVFDASFADARPTHINYWFNSMANLTAINGIENLNTSAVTGMKFTFQGCSALTSLDLGTFDTSNVTDMQGLFYQCLALQTIDLSGWNTQNVEYASAMFSSCQALTTIYVGARWSTDALIDSGNMFDDSSNLVGGAGTEWSSAHIDGEYARIDGGSDSETPGYFTEVTYESYVVYTEDNTTLTFYYDGRKSKRTGTKYDLNAANTLPGWFSDGTRSSVTAVVFDASFADARPTTTICWFRAMTQLGSITGIEHLNTSEVMSMQMMFWNCRSLTALDVSGFVTDKVTTMYGLFAGCQSLTSLDVSQFNTSNVTSMANMFAWCTNVPTLDVSHFNTGKVTEMASMFQQCEKLTSLDVSNFNTVFVTDMSNMFNGCYLLTSLDVSHFNTSNVKSMSDMFCNCNAITSLDLSNFKTDKVTSMSQMFASCTELETIYVGSGWTTENVVPEDDPEGYVGMFYTCNSLVGGAGTSYASSHVDYENGDGNDLLYARVDGGTDAPGYLTYKKSTLVQLGDVNMDDAVTIADVTALSNLILGRPGEYSEQAADVDQDGVVTIADEQELVNIVLGKPTAYVDLGLPSGTLWATCNVGASSPEDFGDYFAWGETTGYKAGKTRFYWDTYQWCDGSETTMKKYCYNSEYGYNGYTDDKTELDLEDDAAYVNLGSDWCTPSLQQFQELVNNEYTEVEQTTWNSVIGWKITSKTNGKSIFLPQAGCFEEAELWDSTAYWTRTFGSNFPSGAVFWFGGDSLFYMDRYNGCPVRAVRRQQ